MMASVTTFSYMCILCFHHTPHPHRPLVPQPWLSVSSPSPLYTFSWRIFMPPPKLLTIRKTVSLGWEESHSCPRRRWG